MVITPVRNTKKLLNSRCLLLIIPLFSRKWQQTNIICSTNKDIILPFVSSMQVPCLKTCFICIKVYTKNVIMEIVNLHYLLRLKSILFRFSARYLSKKFQKLDFKKTVYWYQFGKNCFSRGLPLFNMHYWHIQVSSWVKMSALNSFGRL